MSADDRIIINDMAGDSQMNFIIQEAAKQGASDIHIDPLPNEVLVRFRIDGVLQEANRFPREYLDHVINQLKVLSNLEIGTVRLPEDGHFSAQLSMDGNVTNRVLDVRVSIFPSVNGAAAVLRLLNRSEMLVSLDEIFVDETLRARVREMTLSSYGMVLTTGPTGSGKTTSLYAMLMETNRKERNILTLEDPVEMYFEDMRQSQIHPEIGFSFAKGMKSILRQDPDVIMIGEIRDAETAEYAVQASLTGRLVYSTLHANTTIGAIARMIDMDIERGLIAYAVRGVISQRLVRKICPACSALDPNPRPEFVSFLGLDGMIIPYRKGTGCAECNQTGYRGRTGIFEVLTFDDNLRAMIVDKASMNDLQAYAVQSGMQTLRQNAINLVSSGHTTLEEIIRVV
jgi:type II secretory ATPase GspE/PulE/Tfp pilus assembly ATPase PilB-like protein